MRISIRPFARALILMFCLPLGLLASPKDGRVVPPSLAFMDVRLDAPVKFSHLNLGDTLQGKLAQDSFSGYHLMAPQGSRIDLTVSRMDRQRSGYNNFWPWPFRYFRPKYEKIPVFDFADVSLPNGKKMRLPVSVVFGVRQIHATAQGKAKITSGEVTELSSAKAKLDKEGGNSPGLNLELVVNAERSEASGGFPKIAADSTSTPERLSGIETLQAGTEANLALLSALSASKNRAGDPFKALLVKPLRLNSGEMLPEGTVFEGHVTKSTPPRWLSRAGSLYVTFTRLMLPTEAALPIAASVAGVNAGQRSRMKISSEGGLSGGSPGKARLLIEMGIGAGISKVTDDSYQLIAEALISTATDASTAGSARLVGAAFTGLYLLTRHGRDVTLPRYTTITIRFDRSPSASLRGCEPNLKKLSANLPNPSRLLPTPDSILSQEDDPGYRP